jgi:NAD(P)H-dependent flavin oxidoreductase YrpB (nitropropane dioxygenase family)
VSERPLAHRGNVAPPMLVRPDARSAAGFPGPGFPARSPAARSPAPSPDARSAAGFPGPGFPARSPAARSPALPPDPHPPVPAHDPDPSMPSPDGGPATPSADAGASTSYSDGDGVGLHRGELHPALRTRLCSLVGVALPVVQTGMGWVAGPRLVAATAAAGGLGILASATMDLGTLEAAIDEVRSRTDRPFGVNLRADAEDALERVRLMVERGVRVASFVGAPPAALVDELHAAGAVVVASVGARRHAEKVAELGVDAVIAQGAEGGGHTGSVPTSLLVPDVVDAVGERLVVVAAGGMRDGRSLVAALAWGADGIAMGTRMLLTKESTVPDAVKRAYLATPVTGTLVTDRIDGVPQRVIKTPFVERLVRSGALRLGALGLRNALAFARASGTRPSALVVEGLSMWRRGERALGATLLAANAPAMTRRALVEGRLDAGILPAGQVVGLIEDLPSVSEVLREVVIEANAILRRLEAAR